MKKVADIPLWTLMVVENDNQEVISPDAQRPLIQELNQCRISRRLLGILDITRLHLNHRLQHYHQLARSLLFF